MHIVWLVFLMPLITIFAKKLIITRFLWDAHYQHGTLAIITYPHHAGFVSLHCKLFFSATIP
jgi:hypothetical protein